MEGDKNRRIKVERLSQQMKTDSRSRLTTAELVAMSTGGKIHESCCNASRWGQCFTASMKGSKRKKKKDPFQSLPNFRETFNLLNLDQL